MEKQNYIGRKVKGFSFDNGVHSIGYNSIMDKKIGEIGEITFYDISSDSFRVQFLSDYWFYPASLIEPHLMPDEKEKLEELRDQFAMQALSSLIIAHNGTYAEIYDESYSVADKMLKARKEVKGE